MDPITILGVTASIVACIQLTERLLQQVGPSKHDKRELNRILGIIYGFRGVFDGLKSYLEFNEEDHARLSSLQQLEQPLQDCKQALGAVKHRLDNLNFVGQYIVGSRWDGKLNKLLHTLDEAKKLFELVLHADQQLVIIASFRLADMISFSPLL
jgi:hypothetical protein